MPQVPTRRPKKYFGDERRPKERVAAIFGVIVPPLCLLLDPFVFRGSLDACLLLPRPPVPAAMAAVFVGLQAVALVWVVGFEPAHPRVRALLGGWLLGGGIFAYVLAIIIAPLAALGTLMVIGALGFIPFVTAHVYFAWSSYLRCGGSRKEPVTMPGYYAGFLVAFAFLLAGCLGIHSVADDAVHAAFHGSETEFEVAHSRLRRLRVIIPSAPLERALRDRCLRISDVPESPTMDSMPQEIQRLAEAVSTATGKSPENVLRYALRRWSD